MKLQQEILLTLLTPIIILSIFSLGNHLRIVSDAKSVEQELINPLVKNLDYAEQISTTSTNLISLSSKRQTHEKNTSAKASPAYLAGLDELQRLIDLAKKDAAQTNKPFKEKILSALYDLENSVITLEQIPGDAATEEKLVQQANTLLQTLVEEVETIAARSEKERINSSASMLLGLPLLIILFLGIFFFVKKTIIQPIEDITLVIDQISRGNLKVKLKTPQRQDEIGKLARAFSRTLASLKLAVQRSGTPPLVPKDKKLQHAIKNTLKELMNLKNALDKGSLVTITNNEGTITYASKAFCELHEYRQEEILGKKHSIFKSGKHPSSFYTALWRTIFSGKTWHGDICNTTKTGKQHWLRTTIIPLKAENQTQGFMALRTLIDDLTPCQNKHPTTPAKQALTEGESQSET
ncbi:HAMP domain-containing protein [Candidatus Woesearchaeota archaeon]|nr:MAG: HAMP domain-containing protein [Candidatus Woesearchaeota archaeon]